MPADLTTPKGLVKAKTAIRDNIRAALYDIGDYALAEAKKYPPQAPGATYKRTGTHGRRIAYGKVAKKGSGYRLPIGTNVPYAPFLETGTGIYGPIGKPIKPKKPGGMLVWPNQMGGKPPLIFAKEVAGIKPWHFMENALTGPKTAVYIDARLTQLVDRLAILIG